MNEKKHPHTPYQKHPMANQNQTPSKNPLTSMQSFKLQQKFSFKFYQYIFITKMKINSNYTK